MHESELCHQFPFKTHAILGSFYAATYIHFSAHKAEIQHKCCIVYHGVPYLDPCVCYI